MSEWKDYANTHWNSDGTVYSIVSGNTFQGFSRSTVSTGSTSRPTNGQVFFTYDNAAPSGTQGMGMYLLMYVHNPIYNSTTNDTLLVSSPSGVSEPAAQPGYWRMTSFALSYDDAAIEETNNIFNYA
jgi:hypothetical protein